MPNINKVEWGKVQVDGKEYHQVLVVGEKVLERDISKLKTLFGTTHEIGEWEQRILLSGRPEVILVATGWDGALKVSEEFKNKIGKKAAELKTVLTSKIIREYQRLIKEQRRINALIHTTC